MDDVPEFLSDMALGTMSWCSKVKTETNNIYLTLIAYCAPLRHAFPQLKGNVVNWSFILVNKIRAKVLKIKL